MPIDKQVLDQLETHPALTHLSLTYQEVETADILEVMRVLANHPPIVSLDLTGNFLSQESLQALANNVTLQTLNISGCKIDAEGAKQLARNSTLQKLILNYNQIGDEGALALADNTTLIALEVTGNQIDDVGSKGLAANTILRSLVISSNLLSAESAIALAQNRTLKSLVAIGNLFLAKGASAFRENGSLTYLDLSYNQIGDEGALALAQNAILHELIISYNDIGRVGASAFEHNQTLQSLNISGNNVREDGAKAIARNQTLKTLVISHNQINDVGTESFTDNPSITELDVSYNYVFADGATHLANNKKLQKLNISYNAIGDEGVKAFADLSHLNELDVTQCEITSQGALDLARHPAIQILRLSFNNIDNVGATALSNSTTLRHLTLSHNNISDEGALALAQNSAFQTLALHYNPISANGLTALSQNPVILATAQHHLSQIPNNAATDLKKLFLMTQEFLCVTNTQGIIQFFNPAFSRVLGYRADELLGHSLKEFLHPADRALNPEPINQKVLVCNFENRYLCNDGSFHAVIWRTQHLDDITYAVGRDISEQRKAEKKLIERERQHHFAAVQIEQATLFREKQTEFIAHLCHEVRNPLNGIYGYLELLVEHIKGIELLYPAMTATIDSTVKAEIVKHITYMKEILADMDICAEHQKSILDNNLDATMIEAHKLTLDQSPFDPKEVIYAATKIAKARALQKNITLNVNLPETDLLVKGDAYRFKQVILNLLGNAVKFTEKGTVMIGLIILAQTEKDCQLQIKVKDTGMGMTNEEMGKLFKRFSQANTSVGGQYGGSGLGLHITKRLIELMGGHVEAKSAKGKGSTFQFTMSFEKVLLQAQKRKEQEMAELTALSLIKHKTHRILIVDDNEINQKVLKSMLERAGQVWVIAKDGQEALKQYTHTTPPFDLIFMDILMPRMDGLTATHEIRRLEQEDHRPKVPIVALSGNAQETDKAAAYQAGMDGYLTKPFKGEEIYEKILLFCHPSFSTREEKKTMGPSPKMQRFS